MLINRKYNRQKGTASEQSGGWQIIYTGFILILLCFFILLTSFASLQQSKITQFVRSFSNELAVLSGGRALEPGKTQINGDAVLVDKENRIALLFEKVNQLGQKAGLENIDIRRSAKGVVMTLADKMLFASGDAAISTSAFSILDKIISIIQTTGVPVEIEGHTDNMPISTVAFPSNWELSTARAVNVLRYMTERRGAEVNLLSAVGKSKYDPIVPNDSVANRIKNRRVEIIFKIE